LTAADFLRGAAAEQLAIALDQVFSLDVPGSAAARYPTILQALQDRVTAHAAVLGDPDLTGVGVSSAELFGVSSIAVGQRLGSHLIAEIKRRGSRGGPLKPLADQLNFDESHEQVQQVHSKPTELDAKIDTALRDRGQEPPYWLEHQLTIAQERRHDASAWCDKVLSSIDIDFWEADWRQRLRAVVDTPASLALTARGGSGKSVLTAHLVKYLLQQDPYNCPIVLHRGEDLR